MALDYSDEQRRRNQRSILLSVAVVLAVIVVSGTLQSWSLGSFVIAGVVVATIGVVFWKLFAGVSARPLSSDRDHARWPFVSKKAMDEIKARAK